MTSFDPSSLSKMTKEPGVYLMKDAKGTILYIGKAKNLKNRLKQYFPESHDGRFMVPFLTAQVSAIDTIVTFSEKEALLLENTLIKKHQPKYNVLLKDDKTYISLTINPKQNWPMIKLIRYRGKPKGNLLHFGPYTSAYAARQTLDLMSRIFKLRQCSDRELKGRTRPCLLYSMKRCLAPCVDKCNKEIYDKEVNRAIDFLKGHDRETVKTLKKEMQEASDTLQFEKAAALATTIKQIEHVTEAKQSIIRARGKDCDVFALYQEGQRHLIAQLIFRDGSMTGMDSILFNELASSDEEIWETFLIQHYQNKAAPPEILIPKHLPEQKLVAEIIQAHILTPSKGEKKKLVQLAEKNAAILFNRKRNEAESLEESLLDLQEQCSLNTLPIHIECFDTSNISGSDLVACMVGFENGKRDKKRTKLFKIRNIDKPDDYGALQEILFRHFTRAKEEDLLPDLAIIDGGKGQLKVALDVLKELRIASVDVIGLAKEKGRHDKGMTIEQIFVPGKKEPIILPSRSSTLFLLQKIRDEAHRTAITFHRKRRTKRLIQSALDQVPGIGPQKRKALLTHFGSVKKIKEATREDLEAVPGLNQRDIETLLAKQASL